MVERICSQRKRILRVLTSVHSRHNRLQTNKTLMTVRLARQSAVLLYSKLNCWRNRVPADSFSLDQNLIQSGSWADFIWFSAWLQWYSSKMSVWKTDLCSCRKVASPRPPPSNHPATLTPSYVKFSDQVQIFQSLWEMAFWHSFRILGSCQRLYKFWWAKSVIATGPVCASRVVACGEVCVWWWPGEL